MTPRTLYGTAIAIAATLAVVWLLCAHWYAVGREDGKTTCEYDAKTKV